MKITTLLAATLLAVQLSAQNKTQELTILQADFCVKIAQTMQQSNAHGNQFFSPYSLHQALTMAWSGTDAKLGATNHLEMAKALGWGNSTIEQAGENYQKQLALLHATQHVKLLIANSLWANVNTSYRKEFSEQLEKYYGAGVLPFSTETDALQTIAKKMINAWIARSTNNLITDMLDSVPKEAAFYLINAVYFKGDWASPFAKEATFKTAFTNWDNSQTQVDMMRQQKRLPYMQGTDFAAVGLPYKSGEVSMYVFLPNTNVPMNTWIADLTGAKLQSYLQTMMQNRNPEINLQLPKFKYTSEAMNMNDVFKTLGMKQAFVANARNFPRIIGVEQTRLIWISRILHKTVLDVNEEGAEAAAATAVEMSVRSTSVQPRSINFWVNRPFFVVIHHRPSDAILFAGKFEKM